MPLGYKAPGPVDSHARELPVLRWATSSRDADMDLPDWLVDQSMYLSRGLMAEYDARPDAQHNGPQPRFPRRDPGEGRIGALVEPLP